MVSRTVQVERMKLSAVRCSTVLECFVCFFTSVISTENKPLSSLLHSSPSWDQLCAGGLLTWQSDVDACVRWQLAGQLCQSSVWADRLLEVLNIFIVPLTHVVWVAGFWDHIEVNTVHNNCLYSSVMGYKKSVHLLKNEERRQKKACFTFTRTYS